ncbi:Rieske 2Fe-2S domain-containing protein [Candidatus Saccharibacteria bacterium]|nr:Rieske 2Fe-2S domain-containing protein [Candidatus Saccharibacteria bacterium]
MLTAEDNNRLTGVSAGTPVGELMRRYWHPVLLSTELPNPDCPPVRVRLLGEDFVAFRDTSGQLGIVESRCPHRKVELYFGRNEECGLRCIFHGWKFDVNGNCVDMPNTTEAAAERMKPRAAIKALEVVESNGAIWARFRAPEGEALSEGLSQFPFIGLPDSHVHVSKFLQKTNWAHPLEGAIDTSHFTFLHGPVVAPERHENESPQQARFRWIAEDGAPKMHLINHDAGMAIGAARSADGEGSYWRITQFLMPNMVLTPHAFPGETNFGGTWTPVDDENTWVFNYAYNLQRPLTDQERDDYQSGRRGGIPATDENFYPLANPSNEFMLDREFQASGEPFSFSGVKGVKEQDSVVQYSQGTIHDRTNELLVQTDRAVVYFRRHILEAAQALADGEIPASLKCADVFRVGSGDSISDSDVTFEQVLEERFGSPSGLIAADASS